MKRIYLIILAFLLVHSQNVFSFGYEKVLFEDNVGSIVPQMISDSTFLLLGINYHENSTSLCNIYNMSGELLYENTDLPTLLIYSCVFNGLWHYPVSLENGEFLIFSNIEDSDGYLDYYTQRYTSNWDKKGDSTLVNPNHKGWGNIGDTQLLKLSDGSLLFTWYEWADLKGNSIRLYSPSGEPSNDIYHLGTGHKKMIELASKNIVCVQDENPQDFYIFSKADNELSEIKSPLDTLFLGQYTYKHAMALENGQFAILYFHQKIWHCQFFSSNGDKINNSVRIIENWPDFFEYEQSFSLQDELLLTSIISAQDWYKVSKLCIEKVGPYGISFSNEFDLEFNNYFRSTFKVVKISNQIALFLFVDPNNMHWAYFFDIENNVLSERFCIKSVGASGEYFGLVNTMVYKGKSVILIFINNKSGIVLKRINSEPGLIALEPFQSISPRNDESIDITNPAFTWRQPSDQLIMHPDELKYHLYLSESADFTDPVIYKISGDTTLTSIRDLAPGTLYYWKVRATNLNGEEIWSDNTNAFFVRESATEGIESDNTVPQTYELLQNYPNPFNGATTLTWSLAKPGRVNISIYNMLGQKVATLVDGYQTDLNGSVKWHGRDDSGRPVSSGIYFARMTAGDFTETIKMAFVE